METITPASWYVDDGSDISEFASIWNKAALDESISESVYFTKSSKLLDREPIDGPDERLIICAFYDRVV